MHFYMDMTPENSTNLEILENFVQNGTGFEAVFEECNY